ncbi:MAG: dephospho-CoA kinase, partial [Kiritimatiellae bacterium]|nr:dephospho-CoA kinase [Kiritimatiellia bacterium]
ARDVMMPGQEVFDRVVARFGREILDGTGAIDRARLARIVFADAAQRETLNGLVHPEVLRICRAWVQARAREGARAAVIVPLLYEVDETAPWDAVVCVASSDQVVKDRLRQRGLSEEEIGQRLAAQMPLAEEVKRADQVIQNDGDLQKLKRETLRMLNTASKKER